MSAESVEDQKKKGSSKMKTKKIKTSLTKTPPTRTPTPTRITPTMIATVSTESNTVEDRIAKKKRGIFQRAEVIKNKKEEKEPKMKIIRKKCVIKSDVDWKKKYHEENVNVRDEFERLDKEHKNHRQQNCRTNWEKCQQCNDYRDRLKALYEIGDDYDIMWRMEDTLFEFDEVYEKSYGSWRTITKKEKQWIRAIKRRREQDHNELPVEFTQISNTEKAESQHEDDTQKDDEEEPKYLPAPPSSSKEKDDEGVGGGHRSDPDDGMDMPSNFSTE